MQPPGSSSVTALVTIDSVHGNVVLDDRPNEAFKLGMLSSMHVSETEWDADSAYVDSRTLEIPAEGWILSPAVKARVFGLMGGTSDIRANAPTIEIAFQESLVVAGWVTHSTNPDNDNVGIWGAADSVIRSWQYKATAKP
jgi:hypothetical protein